MSDVDARYLGLTANQLAKIATDLNAENARLRELLSSYWKRVHSSAAPNVERDYLAEMRELGIEVDG